MHGWGQVVIYVAQQVESKFSKLYLPQYHKCSLMYNDLLFCMEARQLLMNRYHASVNGLTAVLVNLRGG